MAVSGAVSRRKLAEFVADSLGTSRAEAAVKQAAAYLIETKRTRNLSLLVRDIEAVLADRGIVVADVTTARPLDASMKAAIAGVFEAKELHVRETVDESVLGGVRVEAAGRRFDGTLKRKIEALKDIKAKKGVK